MNVFYSGKRFCWGKKIVSLGIICAMFTAFFTSFTTMAAPTQADAQQEMRAVWISYLQWETWPKEEAQFKKKVDEVMDQSIDLGMNQVFVHVRPDCDAMYPSKYFPWSKFASGQQGKDPGYDPLAYVIEAAHARGLKFHAWINPFRVTGYHNRWEDVASGSPVKVWLTDSDSSNDRWVLKQNGEYYLNPAIPQVRQLIVNGVVEIVENYDVDGIHFDDYFYPEVNDSSASAWFDKPEYDAADSPVSIVQWRRNNVSELVKAVYSAVKARDYTVMFGISPEGYVGNLRSEKRLFVDIDRWMEGDGYIDYIMPQIYWGFEQKMQNGDPAPFAFENNLNTWIELKERGNVKLYLGLAMYKTATDAKDNNATPEWLRYHDIMKRQVLAGRASGKVSGYCFYAYESFLRPEAQQEVNNLKSVFQ